MNTWHVNVGFNASASFAEDAVFDIGAELEHLAAVLSVTQDLNAGTVALTIDAESWTEALEEARIAVEGTLQSHEIDASVTTITIQSEQAFQDELHEPVYPQVVGYAEIAKMAGVSRQRVRQLAEKKNFPRAVIRTAQGPLYSVHAVERWLESRQSAGPFVTQTKTA
ncbi:helix-turn-helix transcriptional regulator [Enteractinococcus coprophilus]|uniref:Helix-turn-helix domain-containing protein n=1 Tax=Enteractinococcus coprophilus TaxID=1027633 RepID=A0A543AGC9_9MICC|nr:helix-turn-helix domain-containing protein [Enteractinococcus coprophilus]TQL71638.1 hypothetical protein FB556_2127 [Enteractinococcus coprophilus]